MEFLATGGKVLYTVKKFGERIELKWKDGYISECQLLYTHDENGNIVQKGLFRPPMAGKSVVDTGDIVLVQNKQRDVTIFLNGIEKGK